MQGSNKRFRAQTAGTHNLSPLHWSRARVLLVLAAVGFVLSAYLSYAHYRLRTMAGWESLCDINERLSCDSALLSPYSSLGSVPLSVVGMTFYGLFAGLVVWGLQKERPLVPRSVPFVLLLLAGLSCAVSIAIGALSVVALHLVCPACVALYLVNGGLFGASWRTLKDGAEGLRLAATQELVATRRRPSPALFVGGGFLATVLLLSRALEPGPESLICETVKRLATATGAKPLELVMFSDFQCPHCRRADLLLREMRGWRGFKVEHRQYPIDSACNPRAKGKGHRGACLQARAAICGQMLGSYDELSDLLFERRTDDVEGIVEMARASGLSGDAFRLCLRGEASSLRLQEDLQIALAAGVHATPTFSIDGQTQLGLEAGDIDCLRRLSMTR